jgi:hypothetical protein
MPRALFVNRPACKAKRCNTEQTKPTQQQQQQAVKCQYALHTFSDGFPKDPVHRQQQAKVTKPSVTMPQTVMYQVFSFKQKFFTGRNDKHPMSIKCSVTYATEFSARQRGPLFCSEQSRRQKLRILVTLKQHYSNYVQPSGLCQVSGTRYLNSRTAKAEVVAAFTVQRT